MANELLAPLPRSITPSRGTSEMDGTFSCGHPRTEENTRNSSGYAKCRECSNAYHAEWERNRRASMTKTERQLHSRKLYLPKQLRAARQKVRDLEAEALRLGLERLI